MFPPLRDAVLDALAVLFPVECAGCGAWDRGVCDACRGYLTPAVTVRDVAAGHAEERLPVWAGLPYDGVARSLILAFKAQQRMDAARVLAPALAEAVRAAAAAVGVSGVEVVAVPGTRAGYRRRGYDPVRLLIARAGLGASRVFAPARPHTAQKRLGVDERDRNLRGTFRLRPSLWSAQPVAGRRILLIDDVVTTGATLREAARVLREGGAEVVGAAVVASTERRIGSTLAGTALGSPHLKAEAAP
jgi:ComF family protein